MHKLLMEIPTRIETERLMLRPYQAGDGPWYYQVALRNREHLSRYERENPINGLNSEEEAEVLMRDFAANWVARNCFFLGAFEKVGGTFVAQIYVGPVNWKTPEFEMGYIVDQAHEGQGYVSEAVRGALGLVFDHLGAQRASIHCDDTNLRSARVAERCGFALEGHVREDHRHPDDSVTGTLHYGILRREFEAAR
jgi:ribosomal-protein-alanine N-acetyltransferase